MGCRTGPAIASKGDLIAGAWCCGRWPCFVEELRAGCGNHLPRHSSCRDESKPTRDKLGDGHCIRVQVCAIGFRCVLVMVFYLHLSAECGVPVACLEERLWSLRDFREWPRMIDCSRVHVLSATRMKYLPMLPHSLDHGFGDRYILVALL